MRKMFMMMLTIPTFFLLVTAANAQQASVPEIDQAFYEAFGRPATLNDKGNFAKSGKNKAQIVNFLKGLLANSPVAADEARLVVERAYAHGFGRKPKSEDTDYWFNEIRVKHKELGFTDIVNASREYLKQPANDPDRRQVIMFAYLNSMGRFPETGDIDYWQKRMMSEGATFYEISQAGGYYMLGDSPAQKNEFRAAAVRAFEMAKAPAATEEKIKKVQDSYRSFAEKQTAIQGGKPARLRFWHMVMEAGLSAHGSYPKAASVPPAVANF